MRIHLLHFGCSQPPYLPTYLLSLLLHRFYKLSILLGPQLLTCRCIISAVAPHLPSSQAYVLKTTLWKHPARCWRTGVCLHACMPACMCSCVSPFFSWQQFQQLTFSHTHDLDTDSFLLCIFCISYKLAEGEWQLPIDVQVYAPTCRCLESDSLKLMSGFYKASCPCSICLFIIASQPARQPAASVKVWVWAVVSKYMVFCQVGC